MTKKGEPQRWLDEAIKCEDSERCLVWPFAKDNWDHALTTVDGPRAYGIYKGQRVHRLICIAVHGLPPEDKPLALHSCSNRRCCNPHHLRWGDVKENTKDMIDAGRHAWRTN